MSDITEATIYKHTKGNTLYVSIPSRMAQDSAFPFREGQRVTISIQGKKLVIEP